MIIVNQDKKMLLNFDNIEAIIVDNPLEDNDGKFRIIVNTKCNNQYIIAEYKTEEDTKKVLQQIIKSYREYRTAECDGYTNVLEETAVHEMPKE